ncbi:T9SS sorting signal type C domain-containing protein [Flavobacterium sp. LB2P6]|uniref:T9SS sorting signal type C domain-containing protein n=1 Tax=Flavobacterium sp. LB2P6 TaxID=3401714 RepID=UPI003AAF773C
MIKKLLFILFFALVQTIVSAQNIGDYRSNTTTGNWILLTSWQYYNGVSWVTPSGTSPQGYPGQFTGTGAVIIQAGHAMTIGQADLATAPMGTVTISGTLVLDGGSGASAGGTFTLNTQNLIITPDLSPRATINFANKVTLNLPTNVSIQVGEGGLPTPGNGTCNNNIEISIGGNVLAYCSGTGSPAAAYTFTDVINNGGFNTVKTSISNAYLCGSNNFSITGIATPSIGATIKWYTVPSGGSPIYTGSTYSSTISLKTTYYVEASYGTGASAYTTSRAAIIATVNSVTTTTWNGTAWSPSIPSTGDKIVFNGSFSSTADLEVCSCEVTAGNVVINNGHTLKVNNEVKVFGGSLKFENNASLVQTNDAALNSGNITYMRSNSSTRETDYTYWSSPVSGQILKNVSIYTPSNFFYSFSAVADDWNQENSANVMAIGLGYIIRGPHYPSTPPPGFYQAPFRGVPNNGALHVTIPSLGRETSNLIGNPYPSALNADLFLKTNSSVIDGTLYFWTHNTEIGIGVSNPGTGVYAYSSDDYASYNLTGGTATRIGNFVAGVEQVSNRPNGKIAAGQGFFVTGKVTSGDVIFNNSMRVAGTTSGYNSQFFKTTISSKTTTLIEKNRVWLNLTNSEGAFKQMLVGYVTDATNDYDTAFDGQSFDGNEFVDFYSINDDKNLTIQGRALPFDKNDAIMLGYSSTIEGAFSISIDQVDGILASEDVFIEDKMTNSVKNIKEGPYAFLTKAGSFKDRFVLRFTQKTLGIGNVGERDDSVLIFKDKYELKIKSELESIKRIIVFDLFGRKLFDKEAVNSNEFRTSNIALNKQLVVVKVILTNGKVISKKVIY